MQALAQWSRLYVYKSVVSRIFLSVTVHKSDSTVSSVVYLHYLLYCAILVDFQCSYKIISVSDGHFWLTTSYTYLIWGSTWEVVIISEVADAYHCMVCTLRAVWDASRLYNAARCSAAINYTSELHLLIISETAKWTGIQNSLGCLILFSLTW